MEQRYAVWGRDNETGEVEFIKRVGTREEMIAVTEENMSDWPMIEYEWVTDVGYPEVNTIAVNGILVQSI